MAEEQNKYEQDLTIINLNRLSKYDKPPQDGNFSKMSVSVFSNGQIRFNVNLPESKFFGTSVYPFELAIIEDLILPMFAEAVKTGTIDDFKTVINVEKTNFKTKQLVKTMLVVGSKDNLPYIGFKDAEHKAMFPFSPINKVTMEIKGKPITDAHVAIIYANSYFKDLLSSVNEAFTSMVSMGKNVTTLTNGTNSKETDKVEKVFDDEDI